MVSLCLLQGHKVKQRNREMKLKDSPQPRQASGGLGEMTTALCRRVGVGGGKSLRGRMGLLCSNFSTCILFCLPGKNERKNKFPYLGGRTPVNALFRHCPCHFCFLSNFVWWQGLTLMCVSWPICLLSYFTKLAYSAFFEKEDD